jgi:hypothetical protein
MAQANATGEAMSSAQPTRRRFLLAIGLPLDALATVLVGIPVVGYLLGPVRRHAAYSSIIIRSARGSSESKVGRFRRSPNLCDIEDDNAPHPTCKHLV